MTMHRILVVDDEVALARTVALNLEDTGRFEVAVANNGTEALDMAPRFRPDLILLDLMMPDMDGSEVAERLCADPLLRDVPVVFLTAVVAKAEVKAGGDMIGGRCFLAKPARAEELVSCIDNQLRRAAASQR